jgi:hypothetical protein
MKTQQIASIARQVLAILAVIFGVLTASISDLHLPTAVSSILLVAGSLIFAIEHFVSDPSTGAPPTSQAGQAPPT